MNHRDSKRSHHHGGHLPHIADHIVGPRLMPEVHGGSTVNARHFVNNHFTNYSSIVEAARREEYLRLLNRVDVGVPMGRLDRLPSLSATGDVSSRNLAKSPKGLEELVTPVLPPQSFGSRRRQELLEIIQSTDAKGEKSEPRNTDWIHKDDALPEFDSLVLKGFYAATIDESHKKLGDHYCLALTEGLQRRESSMAVTVVILKDNRLSDSGLGKILSQLPTHLRILDISENIVRKKASESLRRHLCLSSTLIKLDLRKTSLSDSSVKAIAQGILKHCEEGKGSLTSLIMAENKIGDGGAAYLAKVLPTCSLTNLDLSWNEIKSTGASAIAEALLQNAILASLDLSWNAIGSMSDKERKIADNLSALLSDNATLTHVDLSQNQLSAYDCGKIGEGLKNNHSLLGLHITGNGGKIDAYGQLMPDAEPWPLEAGHTMTRMLGGRSGGREKWALRNACWICSWWRETRFWHTASAASVKREAHRKQQEYEALTEEIEALSTAPLPLPPADLVSEDDNGDDITVTSGVTMERRGSESTLGSLDSIMTSASKTGGKGKKKKEKKSKKDKNKSDNVDADGDDEKSAMTAGTMKGSKAKAKKEHPFVAAARAERDESLRVLREKAEALNRVIIDFEGRGVTTQLATSFDKWVPEEMPLLAPEKGEDKRDFELYRMVPPGTHYFVFTICKGEFFYDPNQPYIPTSEAVENGMFVPPGIQLPEYVNTVYAEELSAEDKLQGHKALFDKLTRPGRLALVPAAVAPLPPPEEPQAPLPQVVKPRQRNEGQAIAARVKAWTVEESIFYSADRAAAFKLKDVIQRDWDYCRSSQMKDQAVAARCFTLLQQHFGLIKDIYITYASVYSTEVFFMGIGAFNEVLTRCGVLVVETMDSMSGSVASKKGAAGKGSIAKASMFSRAARDSAAAAADSESPIIAAIHEAVEAVEHMTEEEQGHDQEQEQEEEKAPDEVILDAEDGDHNQGDNSDTKPADSENGDSSSEKAKKSANKKKSMVPVVKKNPIPCSRTDVDLCFTANCITGPKHEVNGKRYLNRFQFIDSLIALSQTRYVGPGVCKDKAEAFERIILDDLQPNAEREDPFAFRKTYAMTEQVDTVLKNNMQLLERVYKDYSGAENTPTEQKSMSLREWMDLCDISGHEAYGLGERAVKLSYSRSLTVYKDAFDGQELFRKMYFLEFLEAVVRAAYFIRASGVIPPSVDDPAVTAAAGGGGGSGAGDSNKANPPIASAAESASNSQSISRRRSSGNIVAPNSTGIPDAAAVSEALSKRRSVAVQPSMGAAAGSISVGGGGAGAAAAAANGNFIVCDPSVVVTLPQLAETLLETIRRMKPKAVNKGAKAAV